MTNPLTGDYEGALQVSQATVNRLLASMHQTAGADTTRPSFPHSVALRLGDVAPVDGVRGTVWAQVGTPSVDLIDHANDRFWLQAGVRARFVPDATTTHLPEFINGTVRAMFELAEIDPDCFGWRAQARDYLWLRVVADTVTFEGTAVDLAAAPVAVADPTEINAMISRQLAGLLAGEFAPRPQRISGPFRQGEIGSLNHPTEEITQTVNVFGVTVQTGRTVIRGGAAVVLPVGITAPPPTGQLASITGVFLGDRDVGFAISRDAIMGPVQDQLVALGAQIQIPDFEIVITISSDFLFDVTWYQQTIRWVSRLDGPLSASWYGGPIWPTMQSGAVITVQGSVFSDAGDVDYNLRTSFSVELIITFAGGVFQVTRSEPAITVVGAGDYNDDATKAVTPQARAVIIPLLDAAVAQLQTRLNVGLQSSHVLVDQLRALDSTSGASFDDAQFSEDGVAVLGRITVAARKSPELAFATTSGGDGYTALASWIPGGTVDALEWTWGWSDASRPGGSRSYSDRFLLPHGGGLLVTKFGVRDTRLPLPGLDGGGTVCLAVSGTAVGAESGPPVPVTVRTGPHCVRSGFSVAVHPGGSVRRIFQRLWSTPRTPGPDPGPVEVAVLDVTAASGASTNTLVAFIGERLDERTASTVDRGLKACRREDAGLVVMLLFADGALSASAGALGPDVTEIVSRLEAPTILGEDVDGGWTRALALPADPSEPAWRLLSPSGGISWMHDGAIDDGELAGALDGYLFAGSPATPVATSVGLQAGSRIDRDWFRPTQVRRDCPPPPGLFSQSVNARNRVLVFVQPGAPSSTAQLKLLRRATDRTASDRDLALAVVVDGADAERADRLVGGLGDTVEVLPDPTGAIADTLGVRVWPTIARLDEQGVVLGTQVGLQAPVTLPERPPQERSDPQVPPGSVA